MGEIVKIEDYAMAVLEIQNGTIDAISIDEVVARFYLNNDPDAYRILSDSDGNALSLATEDYVIGFRKSDNALKEKVEEALREMSSDGTMKTSLKNGSARMSPRWNNNSSVIFLRYTYNVGGCNI